MSTLIMLFSLFVAIIFVPPYLWRVYKPYFADIMSRRSGSDDFDTGSETGFDDPVPPRQNQVEPELVRSIEGVFQFLTEHNLTDEQAVAILALMRRSADDHLLSANKIRDIVGGADAQVKAQVAARRPKAHTTPSRRLERPAGGW